MTKIKRITWLGIRQKGNNNDCGWRRNDERNVNRNAWKSLLTYRGKRWCRSSWNIQRKTKPNSTDNNGCSDAKNGRMRGHKSDKKRIRMRRESDWTHSVHASRGSIKMQDRRHGVRAGQTSQQESLAQHCQTLFGLLSIILNVFLSLHGAFDHFFQQLLIVNQVR